MTPDHLDFRDARKAGRIRHLKRNRLGIPAGDHVREMHVARRTPVDHDSRLVRAKPLDLKSDIVPPFKYRLLDPR